MKHMFSCIHPLAIYYIVFKFIQAIFIYFFITLRKRKKVGLDVTFFCHVINKFLWDFFQIFFRFFFLVEKMKLKCFVQSK